MILPFKIFCGSTVDVRSLSACALLMCSESMLAVVAASFKMLALGRVGSETLVTIKDPSLENREQFRILFDSATCTTQNAQTWLRQCPYPWNRSTGGTGILDLCDDLMKAASVLM